MNRDQVRLGIAVALMELLIDGERSDRDPINLSDLDLQVADEFAQKKRITTICADLRLTPEEVFSSIRRLLW